MNTKDVIRRFIRRAGYDLTRFSPSSNSLARRKKLLEYSNINLVLDVGANKGQYAQELRSLKYKGKIISFEPLTSAYETLFKIANLDNNWVTMNCALGDTDAESELNISENSQSSSILDMLSSHIKSAPDSKYIGKEKIEIKTLDSIWSTICPIKQNIWLKIDTQGYEKKVIEGARNSLKNIDMLQLEMSLVPLYQNEMLFDEMIEFLKYKGYRIVSIETGFTDAESGHLLQVDGIFRRL